jgi:7-cyano-7-deazaguanine reductase
MSEISRHLGQKSQYKKEYDPSLLVKELRQDNRTYLGLDGEDLPFHGYDTWNAYEVSALTNKGLPLSFVVKLWYPCTNEYIVESKSLKLYFNSFAMTKLGDDMVSVKERLIEYTQKDLSDLLECNVQVNAWSQMELIVPRFNTDNIVDWENVHILDIYNVECDSYSEDPSLLKVVDYFNEETKTFFSSSLVSCCKVTGQPDSGDVFINIVGNKIPTSESLLQYIVSFRNENHFHEEICEAIWKRLNDLCEPVELSVMCLYARRGGIDINPLRTTKGACSETVLCMTNIPPIKMPRQ